MQSAVMVQAPGISIRLKPEMHDVGPVRVGDGHASEGHTLGQPPGQAFMLTGGHSPSDGA